MGSPELGRGLDRLLEETRLRIAAVTLDEPELDAVAAPPPPAPERPRWRFAWPALADGWAGFRPGAWARLRRADLLLGAVAVVAAGWLLLLSQGASIPRPARSVPLPLEEPMGPVARGGKLYVLDGRRLLLYALSPAGEVQGVAHFPVPGLLGLAASEDGFWTSETGGKLVLRSEPPGSRERRAYFNPARAPGALAWDGSTLWASDARAQTVFQLKPQDSLLPLREVPLAGLAPVGLHRSGDLLWVLDRPSRMVYRYRLGPLPRLQDQLPLAGFLDAQARVRGMAVDGRSLWLVTESPATLHRFQLAALRWREAPSPLPGQ